MNSIRRLAPLLLTSTVIAALPATSAQAQSDTAPAAPASAGADDPGSTHPHDSDQAIVVVGRMVSGHSDPISAPVVLQGDSLTRNLKPQIGDMLASLPGVSSSGFAPGVSRPVLRGFDGPRVQVLLDGIGSLDASSVSADHAVSLDTLGVDRIDVLHGPSVLQYASDPSGGAVNAVDKRIPRTVPDQPFKLDATGSYGTAADSVLGAAAVEVKLAPRFVARIDGSYNHSNDLRIGGYALSPQLRADTLAQVSALAGAGDLADAAVLADQANRRGTLANSGTKGWTYGGGLAFIDQGGDIGVSYQRIATDYDIPPRPSTDLATSAISLRQNRIDLRAGVNSDGFFKRISLRAAYGDYRHVELEDGAPGTTFRSQAIEARLEAEQARRGGWSGTTGVQLASARLAVSGDEQLLPDNSTRRFAGFTVQRLELGNVDLEGAARFEHVDVAALRTGPQRSFDLYAGAAGVAWHPAPGLTLSASYSHGERAPAAEELFVDGAHDATQSYERGNPNFGIERSNGIEAAARYTGGDFAGSLTLFATNFRNFITAIPTGEVIEELPVFQYSQASARFRGLEAEGALTFARWGDRSLMIDGGLDYTHANLVDIGPVPRIPPLRVRGGLGYKSDSFELRGDVDWYAKQDRVTTYEIPTSAYTLVGASATWRPMGKEGPLSLILSADNLFDVTGRLASSETRDFVPIAGRDVRITARLSI